MQAPVIEAREQVLHDIIYRNRNSYKYKRLFSSDVVAESAAVQQNELAFFISSRFKESMDSNSSIERMENSRNYGVVLRSNAAMVQGGLHSVRNVV